MEFKVFKPLTLQEPRDESVDVIIIGAGLSGLTSALKILQKERSLRIKILEASDTIGGQIGSTRLGEIGGKWITENQTHICNLMEDFNVPTKRRSLLAPHRKRCWDIDRGPFSALAKYELSRYLSELDLMKDNYRPGRWDLNTTTISMYKHICNRLFFGKSRKFMTNLVQLVCGLDAQNVTFSHFMSICNSCGGLKSLIDIYFILPTTLKEISSQKLLQVFETRLQVAQILFWRKVYEIQQYVDRIEVRDSESETHIADVVIIALPWNKIQEIAINPPIPEDLRRSQVSLNGGSKMITSFIAQYIEGHWRTAGYSGNFLVSSPMLIIGNEYRSNTYSGIIIHEEGIEPIVRSIVLQALAEYFGEEMLQPLTYTQHTYCQSPLTKVPFTTPWNRIIWSSSATAATCNRGCLSGAVQSGLRGALNALLVVRPQTVTWQDIAEIQNCERTKATSSAIQLWISSLNLYNVTYYGVLTYGVVSLLRALARKYYS